MNGGLLDRDLAETYAGWFRALVDRLWRYVAARSPQPLFPAETS